MGTNKCQKGHSLTINRVYKEAEKSFEVSKIVYLPQKTFLCGIVLISYFRKICQFFNELILNYFN
jgi:hypothetical protein